MKALPVVLILAAVSLGAADPVPRFISASVCSDCHSLLPPPSTGPAASLDSIAPHALWSASMMAYSARDPYWRGRVRFEASITPGAAAEIEDTCLSCHAPAQQRTARAEGRRMRLDELKPGSEGVTCSVCHQIGAEGLGTRASFTAGFRIDGSGRIYGPHADPFTMPMRHHTGYTPAEGRHILESAMCGSCHTVVTRTLDAEGAGHGEFVEQAPFLEWLASDSATRGRTCQSCHVPELRDGEGDTLRSFIAHRPMGGPFPPTSMRKPFGLHFFTGGNYQIAPLAGANDGQAATDNLARAVTLEVDGSRRDGLLLVNVQVVNRTGHKLPTGYPGRRMWLHTTVRDAAGSTVFASGEWDPASGELRADPRQPHRTVIREPREVMVYGTEMADIRGEPALSLVRAARFLKDNRILPSGFDPARVRTAGFGPESVAPVGTAGDPDFQPGSDRVRYEVPVSGGGPHRVRIEVCYQGVTPREASVTGLVLPLNRRTPVVVAVGDLLIP